MNLRTILASRPRALVVAGRAGRDGPPVGRAAPPRGEDHERSYTLAGHVAAGTLPLDGVTAPHVAKALEREYRRYRRRSGGDNGRNLEAAGGRPRP